MTILGNKAPVPLPNNRKDMLTRRVKVRAMVIASDSDYAIVGFNKQADGKVNSTDQDLYMHLLKGIYTFDPVTEGIAIVEFEVDVLLKPIDEVKPVVPEIDDIA